MKEVLLGTGKYAEIKLHADDPEPLKYAERVLGGKIYGIYENNGRRFWHYHLRGFELRSNIRFFYQYLPNSKKRTQFLRWAKTYNLEFWDENEVLEMKPE